MIRRRIFKTIKKEENFMKRFFCLPLLFGALVLAAAEPQVKLIKSTIINDKVVDALSPGSMAVTSTGDILVTFVNQGDAGPGAVTYVVRSKDQGRTWSAPEQEFHPEHNRQGKAVSLTNLPDGSILRITNNIEYEKPVLTPGKWGWRKSKVLLERSTDDAKTFEPVQELEAVEGALTASMERVYVLSNGDLILPAYCYNGGRAAASTGFGSGFFRSTDGGKTWGKFEVAFKDEPTEDGPFAFNESAFAVGENGVVYGFARTDRRPKEKKVYRIMSTDNGKTWTKPEKLDLPKVDYPMIVKLSDGKGFLMIGGNNAVTRRTVTFYYSADGKDFKPIGEAFYQPDDRHMPMNSATGGSQNLIKIPGQKDRFFVAFYAHDPQLPGRHKTRIEGNLIELVLPR